MAADRPFDDTTIDLLRTDLQVLLQGVRLPAFVNGTPATIACGDSVSECDSLFAEIDFSTGAVLVSPQRDIVARLISGLISQMGAYVYDSGRRVLGNLCIRMAPTDPTAEELLADGYESLNRILSIAAGEA